MVPIDLKSIDITFDKSGAIPANYPSSKQVVCHLTKGFNSSNIDDFKHAFGATATAKLVGGAKAAEGWRFGFLQTHGVRGMSFYYAGETEADGSISIEVSTNPGMQKQPLLDTLPEIEPWTSSKPHSIEGTTLSVSTGDHPACKAASKLTNRTTKKANYLHSIYDKREFCTVFVAKDPKGTITQLAHFNWTLIYDYSFVNTGSGRSASGFNYEPYSYYSGSSLTFGKVVKSPPTDAKVAAVLKSLARPYANANTRTTITAVVGLENQTGRTDSAKSLSWVPLKFYLSFIPI